MPLAQHYQAQCDEFFQYLDELGASYQHAIFSYAALKKDEAHLLLSARLFLNVRPSIVPNTHFNSANIRAGCYLLSELSLTPKSFLASLLRGSIETPDGNLLFPYEGDQYTVFHMPFHQEGINAQKRLSVLQLAGLRQLQFVRPTHLDWEVRSCEVPFDGLADLFSHYHLAAFNTDNIRVEIISSAVVEVDFSAKVDGTIARPALLLAHGLEREKSRLSYRVLQKGHVVKRGFMDGDKLDWTDREDSQVGVGEVEIPQAAHVHSIASYNGIAQHFGWIADRANAQNSRRAAYEATDPGLMQLQNMLQNLNEKVRNARDLELVVSWLLWMLGFNPIHLGTHSSTQDAADVVVVATPAGHLILVECTTGILKTQKLSLLYDRAQAVRAKLQSSGNQHLRAIAAIVTTKSKSDLGDADIEFAEKQGILVITAADLDKALIQTSFFYDADQAFLRAEHTIKAAYEKPTNRANTQ